MDIKVYTNNLTLYKSYAIKNTALIIIVLKCYTIQT